MFYQSHSKAKVSAGFRGSTSRNPTLIGGRGRQPHFGGSTSPFRPRLPGMAGVTLHLSVGGALTGGSGGAGPRENAPHHTARDGKVQISGSPRPGFGRGSWDGRGPTGEGAVGRKRGYAPAPGTVREDGKVQDSVNRTIPPRTAREASKVLDFGGPRPGFAEASWDGRGDHSRNPTLIGGRGLDWGISGGGTGPEGFRPWDGRGNPPRNGPGRKRVNPHHGRYAAWKGAHEEQTPGFQPKFSEPAPSGQDCAG